MDLSSLLQWWDEWQLSVLVLASLAVKCFLAVAAAARKSYIRPVYRFFIWLSYLGGDALAIYALAALLNIQKKAAQEQESSDRGSRALQLLWAPIMLMHLGGLANISAYNIEDNELWRRHIATSVSQVAVALYVFCKLWSSSADKRLLAAAILLFIPGVLKCVEKPLALRRSSFYNLVSQPISWRQKLATDTEDSQQKKSQADDPHPELSLEAYIVKAKVASEGLTTVNDLESDIGKRCLERLWRPDMLFVDLARPYSERARAAESFWKLQEDGTDQKVIGIGISNTFDLLYTKDFTLDKKGRAEHLLDLMCSLSTWVLSLLAPIAAIGLLHSGHTEAYRGSDVKITFVMLYLTLLVDACSILSLNNEPWHGMVAQHNLMALLAHNQRRPWLARAAGLLGCAELLDHLFFRMEPCDSSGPGGMTSAVRLHVQDGWNKYIKDAESYSNFSDMRGQWTPWREKCDKALGGSLALERPFDEAVVIWHLATDLALRMPLDQKAASSSSPPDDSENTDATLATQISNYMMHLLFSNPEMLMPGSRTELCSLAYREMEGIEDEEARRRTQNKKEEKADKDDKGFVYAACRILSALEGLDDKEKAWRVIRGVWVEMLCYSAIRCRGYLHAKSLGSGGEYLTFVWLLMAHAGLETFPERQQRTMLPATALHAAAAAQPLAPLPINTTEHLLCHVC